MRRLLIIIGFSLQALIVYAQQEVLYTQYMFNGLALNPGYAGNKNDLTMNLTYRNQWTKVTGSPKTMLFSIDKGLPDKNLGIGFHIFRDEIGLQKHLSPFFSVAYRVNVAEGTTLSAGLAFGFSQYQLDGAGVIAGGGSIDPSLPIKLNSTLMKDAKFGLYLSNDKYYVGLSASNLFNNNINYQGNHTTNIVVPQRLHYFLTAGYIFEINEQIKLYPSFLIRENFNVPTSTDINAFMLFNEKLWVGVSYRTAIPIFKNNALQLDLIKRANASGSVQFYPSPGIRVGYSYDFNIAGLNNYFGGSHEISIGYALLSGNLSKRMLSPRYY